MSPNLRPVAARVQAPIADYALIGDTRAAALVSKDGSIDWLSLPRFDSPPAFGRLVDPRHGGNWSVSIRAGQVAERRYAGNAATLETTWEGGGGRAVVSDGMVIDATSSLRPLVTLVRAVECLDGEVNVDVEYRPRFDLPGREVTPRRANDAEVVEYGGTALALRTTGNNRLSRGDRWVAVVSVAYKSPLVFVPPLVALDWLRVEESWWEGWAAEVEYGGPFREAVLRSLVTLRLLTFSPSGAVLASPTTSLPEALGEGRNWDYRYAWPRDASLASGAFTAAGKVREAAAFLHWLIHTTRLTRPRIEVLYTLDGTPGHREIEVGDVGGYRGSRPVRIGNAASKQHQLDVYGWVVDAAWHLHEVGSDLDRTAWSMVADFADFAAEHWRSPDAGIWEVRGQHRHYTSSKLMAWLALDRAAHMAADRGTEGRRRRQWEQERVELRTWILNNCVDKAGEHLVQAAGSRDLDASTLLAGMSELLSGDHHIVTRTIAAVRRELETPAGLVYRYAVGTDGLAGEEGCFVPCSFWLVEALARAGDVRGAEELMAKALRLGNEVGLFAEELTADGSEMLGNIPLAFSHAALVRAAFAIEAARRSTA